MIEVETKIDTILPLLFQSDMCLCVVVTDDVGSESTVTGHVIRDRQEMTDSAGVTAGQAETVLDVMEQESKLRYESLSLSSMLYHVPHIYCSVWRCFIISIKLCFWILALISWFN